MSFSRSLPRQPSPTIASTGFETSDWTKFGTTVTGDRQQQEWQPGNPQAVQDGCA